MVKFIASDLDGTLLDEKTAARGNFRAHRTTACARHPLRPRERTAIRQPRKALCPRQGQSALLCENGALVKYRGETLYLDPIADDCLKDALDEIRALPDLYPMLCGADYAYIENNEMPFFRYAMLSYTNCKKVENLDAVIGKEPVCKIAVYDAIAAAEHCIKVLPQRLPRLRTIISGFDWCDISATTANKGRAVRFIQEKFGFQRTNASPSATT